MDPEPKGAPLKVCRHCSVASHTAAESCPACGKPYRRRPPLPPRWLAAVLIVALAFGIGYGVRKLAQGDTGGGGGGGGGSATSPAAVAARIGIPRAAARAVPTGTALPQVVARFPGKRYVTARDPRTRLPCVVYLLADQPGTAWQFCFQKGKLSLSSPASR
jgi:hypothetical protein